MRRLIPLMVDTTLRHLLWMLEQWPELHLGVILPTEAVSDVRHVALGEQGYWIPRLSHEAHDFTVLDQDTPSPDGAPLPSQTLPCSLLHWCVGSPSCLGLNSYKKANRTVIFVSHDMSAVREYCDRAILMENSEIIYRGKADRAAEEHVTEVGTVT